MPMVSDSGTSGNSTNSQIEPLSAIGINLRNTTEASEFLEDLLDDSVLQYDGIKYSKFVWYGIVAAISLAAAVNVCQKAKMHKR